METTWEDPERDAEIGRKFNLWSAGCRTETIAWHQTPPVILSMPDVLSRMTSENSKTWGSLNTSQLELVRLARRTLFELRAAVVTRRSRF